jgi:glycosyltransferase involved in cell wall biosynthesis
MKDPTFVSAIIRVAEKPGVVREALLSLDQFLYDKFKAYEIVVVNDAESDHVGKAIADVKGDLHGVVVVLEMAYHQGVETAMLAGLDRAMGDFVYEIDDARLDYAIEILDEMYSVARSGYDVVAAVPENLPIRLKAFYWACNRLSSFSPRLGYERIRISSRRAVDALLQQPERVRYRQVLYRYSGYRHSIVRYRSNDKAALRRSGQLTFGIDIFWSFADAGVGISRKLMTIFAVIAAVALIGTLARTAADPWYVLLEVVEIIGFTAVFILLTIVCEYLALILAQVRGRPLYTLDRTLTRTTLLTSPGEHSEVDYAYGERDRALEQMRRSHLNGD